MLDIADIIGDNMEDFELSDKLNYFITENDRIMHYDKCDKSPDKAGKTFHLVGKGIICMVKGEPQCFEWENPDNILYFYQRKSK